MLSSGLALILDSLRSQKGEGGGGGWKGAMGGGADGEIVPQATLITEKLSFSCKINSKRNIYFMHLREAFLFHCFQLTCSK